MPKWSPTRRFKFQLTVTAKTVERARQELEAAEARHAAVKAAYAEYLLERAMQKSS